MLSRGTLLSQGHLLSNPNTHFFTFITTTCFVKSRYLSTMTSNTHPWTLFPLLSLFWRRKPSASFNFSVKINRWNEQNRQPSPYFTRHTRTNAHLLSISILLLVTELKYLFRSFSSSQKTLDSPWLSCPISLLKIFIVDRQRCSYLLFSSTCTFLKIKLGEVDQRCKFPEKLLQVRKIVAKLKENTKKEIRHRNWTTCIWVSWYNYTDLTLRYCLGTEVRAPC